MLINALAGVMPTRTVLSNDPAFSTETAASDAVLGSAARPLAGFGPGAVVRVNASIDGGYPAGIAGGAGKAASGYALDLADVVRRPRIRFSAADRSTVQSTVQHNTTTLLIPVTRGGVGPHPRREHPPA
ncbi:MAG TPA: hypothetical protein VEH05_02640 [Streptosporangiaceae bacterium]|nr:hypothetical protein [Streptosporangiaceae bacterium]